VLVGSEIGVDPDADLEYLVGDLALLPILELLRAVNGVKLTGRVLCGDGEVVLEDGEVIAATRGQARGVKAFLRLSNLSAGPFRVDLRPPEGVEREIREDLKSLIFKALE